MYRNEKRGVPLSPYLEYCDGYGNPESEGRGYLLGCVLGVGKTQVVSSEVGSEMLESIIAFDKAEVEGTNIGQINMITVSSFCGPQGLIWGYDIARHQDIYTPAVAGWETVSLDGYKVPVYSLYPILDACKRLFGTVDNQRFPIIPGGHVPCAAKYVTALGPGYLYCSLSLGIARYRDKAACLLMEDVGQIVSGDLQTRKLLMEKGAHSILQIGQNQNVEYAEIFTSVRVLQIEKEEIGCCLVAAPYFTLARNAFQGMDWRLADLDNWEGQVLVNSPCYSDALW